jgi:lipoprotein signal peptidase
VVLGRPAVRAFEPLLLVRRFASILVVLAVVVDQSTKNILIALGVGLERSKLVARLTCTGNSGVEFSHCSVLTPVTPADIVSVLVANLVGVK